MSVISDYLKEKGFNEIESKELEPLMEAFTSWKHGMETGLILGGSHNNRKQQCVTLAEEINSSSQKVKTTVVAVLEDIKNYQHPLN